MLSRTLLHFFFSSLSESSVLWIFQSPHFHRRKTTKTRSCDQNPFASHFAPFASDPPSHTHTQVRAISRRTPLHLPRTERKAFVAKLREAYAHTIISPDERGSTVATLTERGGCALSCAQQDHTRKNNMGKGLGLTALLVALAAPSLAQVAGPGCLDGTREGFTDAVTYPRIAACSGTAMGVDVTSIAASTQFCSDGFVIPSLSTHTSLARAISHLTSLTSPQMDMCVITHQTA